MIRMNDPSGPWLTCTDGHVQSVHDQGGVLFGVDSPADDLAAASIQHGGAVDLALPGGMLGDVRDPQLVQRETVELAVDQVVRCGDSLESLDSGGAWKATDSGASHEDGDEPAGARNVHSDGELGVDAAVAVGAAGGDVDLPDQTGQPAAAQLSGTGRALSVPVIALTGDAQQAAAGARGCPGVDESVDHRVRPFGATPPSSSSHVAARRRIAISCSSCRTRPRAARSSADS